MPSKYTFRREARPLGKAPRELLSPIDLVMLDVDGCLTDGGRFMSGDGVTFYRYSVLDGLGVWLMGRAGLRVVIVSAGDNPSVPERAKQWEVFGFETGVTNKEAYLLDLMSRCSTSPSRTCAMGDDLWDVAALRIAGVSVCPANAHASVMQTARFYTRSLGGNGAVRELADRLLEAKGITQGRQIELLA